MNISIEIISEIVTINSIREQIQTRDRFNKSKNRERRVVSKRKKPKKTVVKKEIINLK